MGMLFIRTTVRSDVRLSSVRYKRLAGGRVERDPGRLMPLWSIRVSAGTAGALGVTSGIGASQAQPADLVVIPW